MIIQREEVDLGRAGHITQEILVFLDTHTHHRRIVIINNYGRRHDYTNNYSRFYENAKNEYQKKQRYTHKTNQAYQKWYDDAKKRKQEEQFERDQYRKGRYYQNYEDFKREYNKQTQNRNYQQNFSRNQNQKERQDFNNEWRSMRGQYRPPSYSMKDQFMQIYLRIMIFLIALTIIEGMIRRLRFIRRQETMYYYYGQGGLDGNINHQQHPNPGLFHENMGAQPYVIVPVKYKNE